MDECYFITNDGQKVYNEKILSHIGLAQSFIEKTPILKKEFEKSRINDPSDFLVRKGYLKVSNMGYYKKVAYLSTTISEKQMKLVKYFKEEGYEVEDYRTFDKIYNIQEER